MMENNTWKEYRIKDLGDVITGKTPSKNNPNDWGENMPFVTPTDYKNYGKYAEKADRNLSKTGLDRLKNKILPTNSILVTCIGSDMGKVVINRIPVITNQQINSIIPNDEVNSDFLYYRLISMYETLRIYGGDGTAVPIVNKGDFENIETLIPPLPEQKAIASVLSSLDDKIDLLQQQNQTLEALAETLFRQWFIEEAKEDWERSTLGDIAEVKNGKSFKSSDFSDIEFNSYEVVKMGHIERGGGLKMNPKKDYISRDMDVSKFILSKGDIIMAMTDMKDNVVILGVPAMIDKDDHYVLNQRVARIYLKDQSKLISNYLLYVQLLNKDFIAELQTKANSGVQVNLSTETIKSSEIIIPPLDLQHKVGGQIIDIYNKIEINRIQIQTLTKLRDTLLPKLMSGEVRVKM
ncbi:restriction endonuclease subunit S [Elizabethkingia anophelis]|uniref:Type I restriction modification DNA specificity domain-containing protein n=1 Tax=Elizabethkingia anophelis TaxID=1117645 RepID=A0A494J6B6_9FLAO|nr:restriction endonuclease subunit S [Elizabethkingia anophelis]AQX49239.1 hypothetical protein AYC66_00425 [Elizabethkingia anophelis]MCT4073627.1 restriction endonuclease subunit S [Elizabethkingia anophelis]OPB48975.1 hypothetical protein BAY09_02755 [Elizabethkingia anophelis]